MHNERIKMNYELNFHSPKTFLMLGSRQKPFLRITSFNVSRITENISVTDNFQLCSVSVLFGCEKRKHWRERKLRDNGKHFPHFELFSWIVRVKFYDVLPSARENWNCWCNWKAALSHSLKILSRFSVWTFLIRKLIH